MAFCFFMASTAWGKSQPEIVGKVVEVSGQAVRVATGEALAPGKPVFKGERVRTADGAMLRLLLGKDIAVQVASNSEFEVDQGSAAPTTVRLIAGGLLSKVRALIKSKAGKPRFEVRAGDAVMGVRGTTFFVKKSENKPVFLCVCEGTVAVRWPKGKAEIESRHHDAPGYIDPASSKLAAADMGSDHGDADEQKLQRVLDGATN